MRISIFFFLFGTFSSLSGQHVINHEISTEGNIYLTSEIAIPRVNMGFTAWLPDSGAINGLIVFTHARRDTLTSEFIIDYALKNQLAVLYATTDNPLEFFFENEKLQEIETYIYDIITVHKIPIENLLYCGMSLEGTRALKLAIFGQGKLSLYKLRPRAIAICDSPLDMVRFHKEMVKAKLLNFNPAASNEGTWVSAYLEANLGGTPADTLSSYINYSPFCYIADGGPNLNVFRNIAVRAYTEPDVNWWIETRRKDYYGMNAIDLAAFVNYLKISGNQEVELNITSDKGYNSDGTRHPHNWSIVDEKDLIDWFMKLIK